MVRVGVCEDDPQVRRLVTEALREVEFEVVPAHRGGEALRLFTPEADLKAIVLDIGLPDGDGRDLCLALRAAGVTAPVLFLTARGGVHEIVSGFGAGGDDYLVKPFAVAELQARVTALARRAPGVAGGSTDLRLDPERFSVHSGSAERRLTPTEFRLFATLLRRPGEVVRRRDLVAAAWPVGAVVLPNTLDSYVRRLRRLLEELESPEEIHTVRGVGYRFG